MTEFPEPALESLGKFIEQAAQVDLLQHLAQPGVGGLWIGQAQIGFERVGE